MSGIVLTYSAEFFKPSYSIGSIADYQVFLKEQLAKIKRSTFIALAYHSEKEITKGLDPEQVSKIETLVLERNLEILNGVIQLNKYNDLKAQWKDSPKYEQLQKAEDKAFDTYYKIISSPLPIAILIITVPPSSAKQKGEFCLNEEIFEKQCYNSYQNDDLIHKYCATEFTELYKKLNDNKAHEDEVKEKITFCISKLNASYNELKDYFSKNNYKHFLPLLEKYYSICKNKAEGLKNNPAMEIEINALVASYNELYKNVNKSYNAGTETETEIREARNKLKETLRRISEFCLSKEILEHALITDESKSRFKKIITSPKFLFLF